MQKHNIFHSNPTFGHARNSNIPLGCTIACKAPGTRLLLSNLKFCLIKPKIPVIKKAVCFDVLKDSEKLWLSGIVKCGVDENSGDLSEKEKEEEEEEDDVCPVDCVREFKTDEEFSRILEKAKETGSLVVVDFYRTSCGSCKYIEQGLAKLCKLSGDQEAAVIFLKHNVIDEYDEQSEVAERLKIRTVPLFHFYKDGVLMEAFATRDKERITAAIGKYANTELVDT
uniref:Thioredoxin-like 4ic isoform X1 n=1 Tax=Rhizophora mucronata TaxID=61149 RepID=A0A2P2KLM4_RHIMU